MAESLANDIESLLAEFPWRSAACLCSMLSMKQRWHRLVRADVEQVLLANENSRFVRHWLDTNRCVWSALGDSAALKTLYTRWRALGHAAQQKRLGDDARLFQQHLLLFGPYFSRIYSPFADDTQ